MTVRDLMMVTHDATKVEVVLMRNSDTAESGVAFEYTGIYSWHGQCTADRNMVDFEYGELSVFEITMIGDVLKVYADGRTQ